MKTAVVLTLVCMIGGTFSINASEASVPSAAAQGLESGIKLLTLGRIQKTLDEKRKAMLRVAWKTNVAIFRRDMVSKRALYVREILKAAPEATAQELKKYLDDELEEQVKSRSIALCAEFGDQPTKDELTELLQPLEGLTKEDLEKYEASKQDIQAYLAQDTCQVQ